MKKALQLILAVIMLSMFGAYWLSAQVPHMSFFLTSEGPGDGANLGGLEGADQHCQMLAEAAGVSGRTWRAYLSTTGSGNQPSINAIDRIGEGPFFNATGFRVGFDPSEMHYSDALELTKDTQLSEKGEIINGRGDAPNRHDVLTGSQPDGTAFSGEDDTTCQNWTSNGEGSARVGHHDREGGGQNPSSWNSAHLSRGCSQEDLQGTGGDGLFYCFATD